METRTIVVRIRHWGKTGKYGPRVYKFGNHVTGILSAAGWTLAHRGSLYDYLSAPDGLKVTKEMNVSAQVPTDAEILKFAEEVHRQYKSHPRPVGGHWECARWIYTPAGKSIISKMTTVEFSPERWGEVIDVHKPEGEKWAEFSISVGSAWEAELRWSQGPEMPPTWVKQVQ